MDSIYSADIAIGDVVVFLRRESLSFSSFFIALLTIEDDCEGNNSDDNNARNDNELHEDSPPHFTTDEVSCFEFDCRFDGIDKSFAA